MLSLSRLLAPILLQTTPQDNTVKNILIFYEEKKHIFSSPYRFQTSCKKVNIYILYFFSEIFVSTSVIVFLLLCLRAFPLADAASHCSRQESHFSLFLPFTFLLTFYFSSSVAFKICLIFLSKNHTFLFFLRFLFG